MCFRTVLPVAAESATGCDLRDGPGFGLYRPAPGTAGTRRRSLADSRFVHIEQTRLRRHRLRWLRRLRQVLYVQAVVVLAPFALLQNHPGNFLYRQGRPTARIPPERPGTDP